MSSDLHSYDFQLLIRQDTRLLTITAQYFVKLVIVHSSSSAAEAAASTSWSTVGLEIVLNR